MGVMSSGATDTTPSRSGGRPSAPAVILRLEGLTLLGVTVVAFSNLDVSWWWFAGLILVPDLSLLGYLAGPRVGAALYNSAHTLLGPGALVVVGIVAGGALVLAIGLIWAAHIGTDRAAGFGLKYATRFNDTHLQRVRQR